MAKKRTIMKPIFTLLLFCFSSWLLGQQMYQHPMIQLLGTDYVKMSDFNTGLYNHTGLANQRFRETSNYLLNRRFQMFWTPTYSLANGFGTLQYLYGSKGLQLTQTKGQTDINGGYSWDLPHGFHQSIGVSGRWRNQWADNNQDGFNDYQNGRQYLLIHNLNYSLREWHIYSHSTYLNSNQHQGQANYDWKADPRSDSLYGFGTNSRQWRTKLGTQRYFEHGRLSIDLNLQSHLEEGYYGQRFLRAWEDRQGIQANYWHQQKTLESHAFFLLERQAIDQQWDQWQTEQDWTNFKFGLRHKYFVSGNWLFKGGLVLDYHTANNWQLLPSIKMDYVGIKKIRLSAMAGRDYQLVRPLAIQQPYFISQRQWQTGDYGADRLWYIGAGAQSEIFHLGSVKQQFKLLYRLQDYRQLYVVDPSLNGELNSSLQKGDLPAQHLFMASWQTNYRKWKLSSVYRWRDKTLPYQNGRQQQFLESRHSTFNSLTFLERANHNRKQQWDFRVDHLWRSSQPLPNGTSSPHLHDLRFHFETGRKLSPNHHHMVFAFIGIENALNQQQTQLYTDPEHPFNSSFDGSSLWGNPIGRRWYAGVRWSPY